MRNRDRTDALSEIEGLLAETRRAAIGADFARLPELVARTDALVTGFETTGAAPRPGRMAQVRAAALANQALIEAAISGIKAGRQRIEVLRNAHRSLRTYDSMGRQTTHGAGIGTVERRA